MPPSPTLPTADGAPDPGSSRPADSRPSPRSPNLNPRPGGAPGRIAPVGPGRRGDDPAPAAAAAQSSQPSQPGAADADRNGCTAPQLRRFIKSRAYVPMHELRRRFAIEGGDDDVTQVDMDPGLRVYVGLPNREGRLLGDLLRSGDIGYELSFDPVAPIVVGVFPMRPVPRA